MVSPSRFAHDSMMHLASALGDLWHFPRALWIIRVPGLTSMVSTRWLVSEPWRHMDQIEVSGRQARSSNGRKPVRPSTAVSFELLVAAQEIADQMAASSERKKYWRCWMVSWHIEGFHNTFGTRLAPARLHGPLP